MHNNKVIVIGLSGKAGAGKNAVADFITDRYGEKHTKQTAFANAVKTIAAAAFGWDKQKDERGRRLLQVIGTEAGRAYNPNIWVNKVDDRIQEIIHHHIMDNLTPEQMRDGVKIPFEWPDEWPPLIILLTDVRFQNEFDYIKSCNGVTVWIERKDYSGAGIGITDNTSTHASETSFPSPESYDVQILNHYATVEHFAEAAYKIIFTHLIEEHNFPKDLA